MTVQRYTIAQVAALLACSQEHVRNLKAAGELVAENIGGSGKGARWRIPASSVDQFLDSRRAA